MNTLLEKLFETYNVSPKNRHEISQIYSLLPVHKKNNLLNNFQRLAIRLEKIEEDLKVEREILIPLAIQDIESVIEKVKKERLEGSVKTDIEFLKQEM